MPYSEYLLIIEEYHQMMKQGGASVFKVGMDLDEMARVVAEATFVFLQEPGQKLDPARAPAMLLSALGGEDGRGQLHQSIQMARNAQCGPMASTSGEMLKKAQISFDELVVKEREKLSAAIKSSTTQNAAVVFSEAGNAAAALTLVTEEEKEGVSHLLEASMGLF